MPLGTIGLGPGDIVYISHYFLAIYQLSKLCPLTVILHYSHHQIFMPQQFSTAVMLATSFYILTYLARSYYPSRIIWSYPLQRAREVSRLFAPLTVRPMVDSPIDVSPHGFIDPSTRETFRRTRTLTLFPLDADNRQRKTRKKERRKKPPMQHIMSASATQGAAIIRLL